MSFHVSRCMNTDGFEIRGMYNENYTKLGHGEMVREVPDIPLYGTSC
jgi:hypothetical protein